MGGFQSIRWKKFAHYVGELEFEIFLEFQFDFTHLNSMNKSFDTAIFTKKPYKII